VLWKYYNPAINLLNKRALLVYTYFAIASASSIIWSKYLVSKYPENDPRHVWVPSSDNYYWYFGSKTQYMNVLGHTSSIIQAFVLSTSFIVALVIFYSAFTNKKKRIYILLLATSGSLYVAIFINLNLVHTYYQIPLLFILAACLLIALEEDDKRAKTANQKYKLLMFIWISGLVFNSFQAPSRGYINAIKSDPSNGVSCPISNIVESPILSLNITTGPTLFYKCKLEGFNVLTTSKAQTDAFHRERLKYQWAYYDGSANLKELEQFLNDHGGKIVNHSSTNWVSIKWN
jgi:hypothetical protein